MVTLPPPSFSCWQCIKHLLGTDWVTRVVARNMSKTSTTALSLESTMAEASLAVIEVEEVLDLELAWQRWRSV